MDVIATLIEATVYDPVSATTKVVRLTNRNDPRATTYNGQAWLPILETSPSVGMAVFNGAFTGDGQVDLGSFVISLADKLGDSYALMAWDGADIQVYAGDMSSSPIVYRRMFRAAGAGASRKGRLQLEVELQTRDSLLDVNLLFNSYAGIGNAEGEADIKGTLKPWVFGDAKFCRPILIDSVRQIYQVSAYGPIENTYAVFEGGVILGECFSDYTAGNYAAFRDVQIPAGRWVRMNSQGLIRLANQPTFPITCHAKGDVGVNGATMLTRIGDIVKRIILATTNVQINAASVAAFNTIMTKPVDLYFDSQVSVNQALKDMLLGVGGYKTYNELGELILGLVRFSDPFVTLSGLNDRLPDVLGINQLPTSSPVWYLRVGGQQCHYVHSTSDVAGIAVDTTELEAQIAAKNKVFPADDVPPSGAVDGDLWPDNSVSPTTMRRFDGGSGTWIAVSNQITDARDVKYTNGETVNDWIPADKGATKGAPIGTDVGGVEAGEIVTRIDVNAETAILWGFNNQNLNDYVDGKLYVAGKPVNTVIVTEIQERIEGQTAVAQKFDLIGVVNETGTAVRLNYDSLLVDQDRALGLVLQELTASTDDHTASISSLNRIVITPNGAVAKALFQLDVDGKIVGYEATNDGSQGRMIFKFDAVEIQSPTGAPLFTAANGVVKMPNVEIDTLKVGSVITTSIAGGGQVVGQQSFAGSDTQITSTSEITVLETPTFFPGDGTYGRALALLNMVHDSESIADNGMVIKVYLNTGGGYFLLRTIREGIQTESGQTRWAIPVTVSIPIESVVGTKIKLTAAVTPFGNTTARSGAWLRNINVDVLRGQR